MKLMYASDCGSTGAPLMFWFHQLSAGRRRRPPKSSASRTPLVPDVPPVPSAMVEGLAGEPPQAEQASSEARRTHRPRLGVEVMASAVGKKRACTNAPD
jgi:hypothetical protein